MSINNFTILVYSLYMINTLNSFFHFEPSSNSSSIFEKFLLKINFYLINLKIMQGEELNLYGKLYIHLNPKLKIKVVDGSSLAVAVVLNSIPKGTTQVLFRGKLSKVAYFTAIALCQKGIQVFLMYNFLKIN